MTIRQLLLGMGLVTALSTAPTSPLADPTPDQLLIGAWEWISSQDAWSGITYTPAMVGYTMQLQCFANGTAIWMQDLQPTVTTTWRFSSAGANPYSMLYIGGLHYAYELTQTSLALDNRYVDGALTLFTRRQPVLQPATSWGGVKAGFRE